MFVCVYVYACACAFCAYTCGYTHVWMYARVRSVNKEGQMVKEELYTEFGLCADFVPFAMLLFLYVIMRLHVLV